MSLVLADTSVWVSHFRRTDPILVRLLLNDQVICHPLVLLEIACGTPPAPRQRTLEDLRLLRSATPATAEEALTLIERERLQDQGCGAIDILLLSAVLLTADARLWTLDKPLAALAARLGVAFR